MATPEGSKLKFFSKFDNNMFPFGSYIVKKSGSSAPRRISLRSSRLCEKKIDNGAQVRLGRRQQKRTTSTIFVSSYPVLNGADTERLSNRGAIDARPFFGYRDGRISRSSTRSFINQTTLFSCTSSPSRSPSRGRIPIDASARTSPQDATEPRLPATLSASGCTSYSYS
jgi:hypothetical protein